MPKQKTKKSIQKRVRMTKNGRLKRSKAFKSHLLSHKNGKRRRQLRKPGLVEGKIEKNYKLALHG
ncbi:MAG: 50S ribosomal protein L35 [Planctomycetota bacterium]